jgi:hypothetical protein
MRHFPLRELGWAVVVVAILVAGYVAAYFTMVARTAQTNSSEVRPYYGENRDWVASLFEPVHSIDRECRREYWSDSKEARFEELQRFFDRIEGDMKAARR